MITGPIAPRHYFMPTASPDPNTQSVQGLEGELLSDRATGRLWVNMTAGAATWLQCLPHVRGSSGTTGVRMVESSGNLRVENPSGLTGGMDAFGQLTLDSSGAYLPNLSGASAGAVYTDFATGQVRAAVPMRITITSDVTLTNTASPTTITELSYTATETEVVICNFVGTFYHSNNYQISAALQYFAGATAFDTQVSTTHHLQNGGWTSIALFGRFTLNAGDRIRVLAWPDTSGVTLKSLPQVTFPTSAGFPTSSNRATVALYQRIA